MKSFRIIESDMNADDGQFDRLAETIERLRTRIALHGEHIGGHETRTRVILIDPLLRSLGWDTEDPEIVVHEHPVGRRKVDYALYLRSEVIGILEAKALGSQLNDSDWGKYVAELPGLPMIAFTNGNEWRFFRRSNNWTRETVKVSTGASFKTGFEFYKRIGRDVPDVDDWSSLFEDFPLKSKPTKIRIGNRPSKDVKTWGDVYVEVGRFLHEASALAAAKIPVKGPSGRTNVVNRSPERARGKPFIIPKEFVGGLWLDAHGGAKGIPRKSIHLLRKCGVDPTTVELTVRKRSD